MLVNICNTLSYHVITIKYLHALIMVAYIISVQPKKYISYEVINLRYV